MKALRLLGGLRPRQILMIGFALFLVYAFPGYMSTDSVNQLLEARAGTFSAVHPPIMAAEWWLLDRIVSGPILVLLLQGAVFLGGLYVLFQKLFSPRGAAWAAVGVLLFPPVMTPMAVIWKDSQMAAFLVAGIAAMVQPRRRTRVIGIVLLAIGGAMRHNGFAAVVPLVFFIFEWRQGIRWWKRTVVVVAASLAIAGAIFGVTRLLAASGPKLAFAFTDIVTVIAYTHERSDEDLRYVLRGTPLVHDTGIQARARRLHDLGSAFFITQGEDRLFDNVGTVEQAHAMNRAWKELVLDDPGAYLRGHWHTLGVMMGLDGGPLRAPVWNLFLEDNSAMHGLEHYASWSPVQAKIGRVLYWLADETPLFRPYVYAILALVLLALFCRDRLTAGLLTSGLLYELSFFPTSPSPDARYSHWMITVTCIATVFLYVQRRRKGDTSHVHGP